MSIVFGSIKYIFKNFWYVMLCAILPAIFLALSLDYTQISEYAKAFFTGNPHTNFYKCFCVWSVLHFHSALSVVYSVCAFVCIVIFASMLFPLVEKHMRLGRRTPNGIWEGFKNAFVPVLLTTLLYVAIYEAFIVVLSSLLFAASAIHNEIAVYILSIVIYAAVFFTLFYVCAAFYLWLPCKLMTGFSLYDSFHYSYRLAAGVRGKLILSFALYFFVLLAVTALTALLPSSVRYVHYIVAFVLFVILFLDFCVRMETVYFKTDKLDREDIMHTFKEY